MSSFLTTSHRPEKGFCALMEINATYACVLSSQGVIMDCGPRTAKAFSGDESGCGGISIFSVVDASDADALAEALHSEAARLRSVLEIGMRLADGQPVRVRWTLVALQLYGMAGTLALGWPEAHWSRFEHRMINVGRHLELSGEAVMIVNPRGVIEFVNPAFCRMSGYGLNEILGTSVSAIASIPENMSVIRSALMAFSSGEKWQGALPLRRKDGTAISMALTIQPIQDYDGSTRYMVIGEDFTRQKSLERKVEELQRMEALGTLANGLAHRFNNILAAISGQTELMIMSSKDEAVVGRAKKILDAARKGKEVVEQIGLFSRKSEPRSRMSDIVPVLRNALRFIRAAQPSAVQIFDNMPESGPELMVNTGEIHQVMVNLLTNALEAIGRNDGRIDVDFSVVSSAIDPSAEPVNCVQVDIRDNGSGIPVDVQPRIFDPFFTTHGLANSSGMGLSITHGIVKRHGGVVRFESSPGQGSVFHVILPISVVRPISYHATGAHRGNLLLVDMPGYPLESGAAMLRDIGHNVVAVSGVDSATRILADTDLKFDLLITSMNLADGSGVDLCRVSRRMRRDMPVLLCADLGDSVDEALVTDAGASRILQRPVPRAELAGVVLKLLESPS